MMPARKFMEGGTLSLPSSVFLQTISGEFPEDSETFTYPEADGESAPRAGAFHADQRALGDRPRRRR